MPAIPAGIIAAACAHAGVPGPSAASPASSGPAREDSFLSAVATGTLLGRSAGMAQTSDDAARGHVIAIRGGRAGPGCARRPPKRMRYERKSRIMIFGVIDNEVRADRDNK